MKTNYHANLIPGSSYHLYNKAVSDRKMFYELLCYIHHNPIHHGLAKSYTSWSFTSFHEYVNEYRIITPDAIFKDLGDGDLLVGEKVFLEIHKDFKINYKERFLNH